MKRTFTEWLAFALEIFVGAGALFGGIALMARPDGALLGMPVSLLQHSPFPNFLVPGVVLTLIVGGSAIAAAVLVLRRANHARDAVLGAATVLMFWMIVQTVFLGIIHPLQPALLSIAFASLLAGARLGRASTA
jgi:hypothetical protein